MELNMCAAGASLHQTSLLAVHFMMCVASVIITNIATNISGLLLPAFGMPQDAYVMPTLMAHRLLWHLDIHKVFSDALSDPICN